ncbi:MAG: phosphatase PAP2 family protein [Bacteroidales bacterium]
MANRAIVYSLLFGLLATVPATGQHAFPYRLDSITESMLLVGGTSLMLNGAVGQNEKTAMPMGELARLSAADVNWLDRMATRWWDPRLNRIREVFEPGGVLLALGGIGWYGISRRQEDQDWEALKTLSMMYFEGLYLTTGATAVAKSVFHRQRPYAFNTDLELWERYRGGNNESFFSGNASILFYNATFISQVFSDLYPDSPLKPWIWATTLGIAGFSASLSVRSGMHYPTDVIAGALAGSLAGLIIPALHRPLRHTGAEITPLITFDGGGLHIRIPAYRPIR